MEKHNINAQLTILKLKKNVLYIIIIIVSLS